MKINHDQLFDYLQRRVAPVYIVSGDEPLLVQEACDAIRAKSRTEGCTERHVAEVGAGFDWQAWLMVGRSQSLFAERQLLELRMPTAKPGDAGAKALLAYAQDIGPDNILLVITDKVEAATQNSAWFKALAEAGIWVTVWPLTLVQMPRWAQQRMQQRGLQASPQAIAQLVERVEGNPLAAAQEIEKLYLLYGAGKLSDEAVQEAVADSARFDIYGLADSALEGDASRVVRILARLQEEGIDPILLLWVLTKEIRSLALMAAAIGGGDSLDKVFVQFRVWDKRKATMRKALSRGRAPLWQAMLLRAATVDRVLKGNLPGNRWDEVRDLALQLAGRPLGLV